MEINLFGVGSIELDKISSRSVCRTIGFAGLLYILLIIVSIFVPLPYATSSKVLCEGECSLNNLDYSHCFKLDYHTNAQVFADQISDTFKLELKFTVIPTEFKEFGLKPNFRYSLDIAGYNSSSCTGSHLFENKVNYDVDFINCNNDKNECSNMFLAEQYYFNSPYFKFDISADEIPYSSFKSFSKIEIVLTQRDYSYISAIVVLKLLFFLFSLTCLCLFLRKIKQFNFADIGIIQRKIINLLIFLILFNEPFYFFNAYVPFRIMNILNTVIQASFFAMILHFWTYVLDTLSEEDMIREDPIKFYFPKMCLVFMMWIFMLVTFALVRYQEQRDPSFYWKYESNDLTLKYLSWILLFILVIYSIYLLSIIIKSLGAIRKMKEGYRFVVGMTISVVIASIFLFAFFGVHTYISMSASALKVASIQGLFNI